MMTNLRVLRNDVEWTTRFDGEISEIEVDGQKLKDIHDLAVKVDRSNLYITTLTKRTRLLAYIATVCALLVLGLCSTTGFWLYYNKDRIDESLTSSKTEMLQLRNTNGALVQKLRSVGWVWEDKKWNQIEK